MVPVMAVMMAGTALNPGIMGGIASAATVGSDCYVDGQVIYTIGSHVSSATVTHIKSVSVAPYSTFSSTTMTAWSATLRAGIDGNFSASAEANIVIGKADAGVSISLHLSGEATLSGSDSVTWTSGPAKSFPRTYAVFSGGIKVTGTWTKQTCGRTFHWGSIEFAYLRVVGRRRRGLRPMRHVVSLGQHPEAGTDSHRLLKPTSTELVTGFAIATWMVLT